MEHDSKEVETSVKSSDTSECVGSTSGEIGILSDNDYLSDDFKLKGLDKFDSFGDKFSDNSFGDLFGDNLLLDSLLSFG